MYRETKSGHLPAIQKFLDTENLRTVTDDALYNIEAELHELISDVRNGPDGTSIQSMLPRQPLLQSLRNASIKLNLAWTQSETKGRTSRYYHYLTSCKEYLERSYEQYVKVMNENETAPRQNRLTETRQGSSDSSSPASFFIRGRACLEQLNDAQQFLQQAYAIFDTADELWPNHCNSAVAKLQTVRQCILNILELLNSTAVLPPGFSSLSYELLVKLYQLDEHMRTLLSLITSFRSLCQTKSRQLAKSRGEILCKLETFEQSYDNLSQSMAQVFKKVGVSEKPRTRQHGLTLVKTLQ